ncbi:MAG: hypothetical protein U0836_17910 [Pirellulales bacterium]
MPDGYRVTKRHARMHPRLFRIWIIDHRHREAGWYDADVCYGCEAQQWVNALTEDARRDGDMHLEYIARELVLGGPKEGGEVLHDTGIVEPGWIPDEAA